MKGLWQSYHWPSESDKSRRKVVVEWKNSAAKKSPKDISHIQPKQTAKQLTVKRFITKVQ